MAENQTNEVKTVQVNPLSQDITVQVETKLVELKKAKFAFRKVEVLDEVTGKPKLDDKGKPATWKRPTLELEVPVLTMAGLLASVTAGDKSAELVLEQANEVVYQRVRNLIQEIISNNGKVELTPDMIDIAKLGFLEIANLPRGERGAGISKEDWEAFVQDYIEVMSTDAAVQQFPDKRKRDLDTLQTHGQLLAGKFNQVKSRKDVVEQMDVFLDVWVANSANVEEYQAQYELLKGKAKVIMGGNDYNNL